VRKEDDMAAIDPGTLDRWRTLSVVDRDGHTVGSVSEFYLDRETRYPTWALVNVGLFGGRQIFVPLLQATEISDGLQVPYEKGHIKDAPRIDLHGELTPDEEAALFAHYGIDYQPAPAEPGAAEAGTAEAGTAEAEAEAAEAAGTAAEQGRTPATDELAWPASPPPPGPITEPSEAPGATRMDRGG
jgi:PRC-barrel domain